MNIQGLPPSCWRKSLPVRGRIYVSIGTPHERNSFNLSRRNKLAFSLIEVTIAIGIVSFAFMAIMGLIPTGLNAFRSAIDTSVSGQIFKSVINETQQTDFGALIAATPAIRYLDDQGNGCDTGKAIYFVNTRILSYAVLASTKSGAVTNSSLTAITVQIAKNLGNTSLDFLMGGDNLWRADGGCAALKHSTMVTRNK